MPPSSRLGNLSLVSTDSNLIPRAGEPESRRAGEHCRVVIFGNQLSRRPRPPLGFCVRSPGCRCEAKDGYDHGPYLRPSVG